MCSQWPFTFVEAFILPLLATEAPKFVEGFLGIASGSAGEMNLGALAAVYALVGVLYMLGGLLFGIATFRAGILPRWAAGLLAFGCRVGPRGFAAPTPARADSGGAAGVSVWPGWDMRSGRNGERKPRNPYLAGEAPAPPNRSRVSSLETAWSGQAAIRPLVSLCTRYVTHFRKVLCFAHTCKSIQGAENEMNHTIKVEPRCASAQ